MKNLKPNKLILIGASTGGPSHIKKILHALPKNFNASIIIAQHMQDTYIKTFASHINNHSTLHVKVAQDKEVLQNATAYVVSNMSQLLNNNNILTFKISATRENSFNPNINELFHSCAKVTNKIQILAFILTGIGEDGAEGMLSLCNTNNTQCIAESQESAIIYGMPLRAKEISPLVTVESLNEIIETIKKFGA